MSAAGSRLAPLLSTHDLKLVCTQCAVKEKEITYAVKPVRHGCTRDLLLCKARGSSSKWRPVSKRPTFPNPSRYEVCYYFTEGSGCTLHKNRCTFARSEEEAAVWNFEKRAGLDQVSLRRLLPESPVQPDSAKPAGGVLDIVDLRAVCDLCCVREKEVTYTVQSVSHSCRGELLLAKARDAEQWRPVAERPTGGYFGPNVVYQVCNFFSEGSGCSKHGQGCTYARSNEEAAVWNHIRDKDVDVQELTRRLLESQSASVTPEAAAENILQQFSGAFVELCKLCFHQRPQVISSKRWSGRCAADAAHTWDPVLVHHLSERRGKDAYSQVRPLPQNCAFKFCSHVKQGKPCWHQAGHCGSAQSEVEMALWKAEHSGLSVRPHLLRLSQEEQGEPRAVTLYCKVCLLTLSSPESFYQHCSSLDHARLLREDTITRWRGRQPPPNARAELWLCDRPESCEYGDKCPNAHSVEELQEWMMRAEEEKEIRLNMEVQGLMSYNERLLEEYKSSSNEVHIISEQVDDVRICCDEDLTVQCEQLNATLQWRFQVETERDLVHVALLKQEPGASFSLGEVGPEPCIYSPGEHFRTEDITYDITVSFTSVNPGRYEQWLVLDFGSRPVFVRKLKVRVGQVPEDEPEQPAANLGVAAQSVQRWHRGNRVIMPCSWRTEEQEELLKEYKPPQINLLYKSSHSSKTPLNADNYREKMHHFLYNEEMAEDKMVSRLNLIGEIKTLLTLLSPGFEMIVAPPGRLFCAIPIPYNLTLDTNEGQALKRCIQSCLVAPLSARGQSSKVYEATILHDHTNENTMHLQLSKQCCSDLALKNNESYQMELQFKLNRHSFCAMHKAVDLLPDTKRVLPDLRHCGVPLSDVACERLNSKQQAAVDFITGSVQRFVAPLLIYGPFGTGKTFTLATAARELSRHHHNKVLICTHTNSSADLYVRDHFHPFIEEKNNGLRPIRIKANKHGSALFATDKITLKYCFLSEDRQSFLPPTKDALDGHNVVITTTTLARHFQDLKLPEGYFTHILIDEASQMLECEALMALGLAGPDTRVILAGDHMQMGPKLFSVDDHDRSSCTLLTRLFHYYQGQKCDAAQSSRIIFSENYRSTQEIVEFVSTNFYVGKNDIIKASGNIPAPANGHALQFYHVRGECLLDTVSLSWYNKDEVAKVVEVVQEVLDHWPSTWGTKDQGSVCVLSEGFQVRHIRKALAQRHLSVVHVENIANVQGKQFRAVIMTAVQTRDNLKRSHGSGLELFNDPRVINTAMTRAQSKVAVVGDAAALCCFGKCSAVWKSYINHCIRNNSVAPRHFTKEFFEKDIMETARFHKEEHVEKSNRHGDAILQELKDEYEQLKTEYSSDEDSLELEDQPKLRSFDNVSHDDKELFELCKKQPEVYIRGTLVRESSNRGHVIPLHNPSRMINIKGWSNLRQVFTGDEVILEKTRVVKITKEAERARVLMCLLESEDHSKPRQNSESPYVKRVMIPIVPSEPRIRILILKKRRNFLPIWEQTDGQWTVVSSERIDGKLIENSVFLVQIISWKEHFYLPLGKVIDILPMGRSLVDGQTMLNEEFKVESKAQRECEGFTLTDEDEMYREDISEDPQVKTFTVDPKTARDLDDAISVKELEDHYELGVHIADVASYVTAGSQLDEETRRQGSTYYCKGGRPMHMFPERLIENYFSLLSGQKRRVVSLMFKVNKETNKIIGEPQFQLSLIKSNKQFSYEDAEEIISRRYRNETKFDTLDDCVTVAYCFAKAQRKLRLEDWAYCQPEYDKVPGKRKAKMMIEELSVLFNTHVSKELTGSERTRFYTPLRCQAKPDPGKIKEFKTGECGELIPLSFQTRHRVEDEDDDDDEVDHEEEAPNCENFRILTQVWSDIQSAANDDDLDKMVDLVAADDIHPLLKPVADRFRKCQNKAYVIRSYSSPKATVGHYSLSVPSYTQASSPIRRYMDIILQRLLHSVMCKRKIQYNRSEITALCSQCETNMKNAKDYEQKSERLFYAVCMKKQCVSKLTVVVNVNLNRDRFEVSFPCNKDISFEGLAIMYKDLQLLDQPVYDEGNHCINLSWRRRIYAVGNTKIHQELNLPDRAPYIEIPLDVWKSTVDAIDQEDWVQAKGFIIDPQIQHIVAQSPEMPCSKTCSPEKAAGGQEDHEVEIKLKLQKGDTLQIQITSEVRRGYSMPAVQLVRIKPKFEICVDHVRSPVTCFSRTADDPSMIHYSDTERYVQVWRPLCEMESASSAVGDSDSIVIEDLVVNFKKRQDQIYTGSFFLHQSWMEDWAIECNLSQCFLCIRKRGVKLESTSADCSVVDPREFTWVAHGVTTGYEEKKNPTAQGTKVKFAVNHLAMENIPDCVFKKDAQFTVEIIPKLVPDIRKEKAVMDLPTACALVKAIALGKSIPKEVKSRWHNMIREQLEELPDLNTSQRVAVDKALNNNFTLIQGPPGTGKTIVGVFIVYCFLKMNRETQRKCGDQKQVILYCGPSNKSVDVVAEYLMRFGDKLKPLRFYSQQVEMLDYPSQNLQFSQRTVRQEKAKEELRDITMHHRMRQDQNPKSKEIRDYDKRIRRALKGKREELTTEEIKEYKRLLREARQYELEQHDIILCTCTQASTPSLTKTVSARQILIDECAMATEPQALIPLVCNKPEKIVLIGDHKQLRPIVKNESVKKLGMAKSLFERYYSISEKRAVMLDTQYRMHYGICAFPSNEYYNGNLKTGVEQPSSVLRVDQRTMPIVFGDIKGETISLIVSTAKGNENSKANKEERNQVISITEKLVKTAKIKQQDIVILSPYNAQVSEIRAELKEKKMDGVLVTTITRSQGSEWRYVLISTVCSLPSKDIEPEPGWAWLAKHVGFVGDPNQINVGITRAKEGLCIIGNQELLSRSPAWHRLLKHYRRYNAVTVAEKITVCP